MEDFSKNLRFLCSFHRSIADLCRQIGINRQQFNKYLAGQSQPSANNLRLISTYFHLNSNDLFLPEGEFRAGRTDLIFGSRMHSPAT
jgi:transcriptional regulator with XRE-family HTH domain